ncbi:hypothetical protein ACPC54_33965 [Kitasatospora sp. NPDC094028]
MTMTSGVRVPDRIAGFWREFVAETWEQRATTVGPPPVDLALGEDWFFDVLVRAATTPPRADGPLVRLWADGSKADLAESPYLPRHSDGSVDGYLRRVDAWAGDREWNLGMSRLHSASFELWERGARFVEGLWRELGGMTCGFADTDVFIGRYAGTPVGIHQDDAGNFMFGLSGTKSILVWPPDRSDNLPVNTPSWAGAEDRAVELVASTTDVGYFPARFWHVGVSPARASATFNIALFFDGDPVDALIATVAADLRSKVGPVDSSGLYNRREDGHGTALPDAVRNAVDAWAAMDVDRVRDRLTSRWLRRVSAQGFGHPFPAFDVEPVDGDDEVCLHGFPVLYRPTTNGTRTIVAGNGHAVTVPGSAAVAELIDMLNAGEVVTGRSAEALAGDSAEVVAAVLYRLRSWRAIDVVPGHG